MSHRNPFIDFLAAYGPQAASENMYDEHIQTSIRQHGIDPAIEIKPPRVSELCQNFESLEPISIILTGTAGDGKTFHCRRVFEHLGGDIEAWQSGAKIPRIYLPASRKHLRIVKDLSELTPQEKVDALDAIAASVGGSDSGTVFLVAANDGQLVASWRDWASARSTDAQFFFQMIEQLLIRSAHTPEAVSAPDSRLALYNLSVLDVEIIFSQLLEQILEHPCWRRCAGCVLYNGATEQANSCPIRINRERLRLSTERGTFRERLLGLLDLSSAGGHHLPIRHLLLLAVNILLGDNRLGSPLLTCRRAQNRARETDYASTNPYANTFGANLSERERHQYQAFAVLDEFGVGRETTAEINQLLIFEPYKQSDRFTGLVGIDPVYGGNRYRPLLDNYLDGDRSHLKEFEQALTRQRQRLFFELPDADEIDPWQLTVFRFGGEYRRFRDALRQGDRFDAVQGRLVKGLNRTFCGMMLEEGREILFSASGGDGRGRIAPLLHAEVGLKRHRYMPYATFVMPDARRVPELWIMPPGQDAEPIAELALPPRHFEYLMRVAAGSLPASFARQCYEDFLDFKIRAIKRLGESFSPLEEADLITLRILSVADDGRSKKNEIDVKVKI